LSQIDFNARVLALAEDQSAPLLERAKFLAIFASNNDEFYQVRVAGLKQQAAAGIRTRSADGLTPQEQLSAIASKVVPLAEHHTFRVTRNADLEIDDRADDLLEALEEELTKRRFSPAVRLEVEQTMPHHVLELLMTELEVEQDDVFMLPAPLDLAGLWSLHAIDRPDLKDEPYVPVTHPDLSMVDDEVTVFEVIGDRDVLVHHPYESFTTSVQRFIEEAAADPD